MIIMKAAYNSYVDSNITTIIPVVKKVVGWFSKTKGNSFLSEMDSDDIIANALTSILVYQDSFDPDKGKLEGWVAKIALNECYKMLNERSSFWKNSLSLDVYIDSAENGNDELFISKKDIESLSGQFFWMDAALESKDLNKYILSRLRASDRMLFTARYDGYSYKEISDMLNLSVNAVGKRIHDMNKRIGRIIYEGGISDCQ